MEEVGLIASKLPQVVTGKAPSFATWLLHGLAFQHPEVINSEENPRQTS